MPVSNPTSPPIEGALGVLLAGGRGRRLGEDKVLAEIACAAPEEAQPGGNRRVAMGALVLEALAGECAELAICVGRGEREARRDLPARLGFPNAIVLEDRYPDCGPLAGLLAGLEEGELSSRSAVFIAACDYPLLARGPVRRLLELFHRRGGNAVLPLVENWPHPLCGVWSPGLLPVAKTFVESGGRGVVEFARMVGALWVTEDMLESAGAFFTVNTPEDRREAELRLRGGMRSTSGTGGIGR